MVRNGYGAKYICYEIAILWYEMVMVQNSVYGQKVTGQKVTNHYFNTHRTKSHKFQF